MLVYILSCPRSGSTVLTALLDKRKGVVCMPESSFPQVLGALKPAQRQDKDWLAALYIAGTFTPTPISFEEARQCMTGDDSAILHNLGRMMARKLGRDENDVTHVVWKTTRTIGMHKGPLATGGKFVVLRRNVLNVYESQFRVSFGAANRNPFRFAVFTQSYEYAFAKLPAHRKHELNYDDLPEALDELTKFIELPDRGEWGEGASAMQIVADSCAWLSQITDKFENKDKEKRAKLPSHVVRRVTTCLRLARPVRCMLGPLRGYFDFRSVATIITRARNIPNSDMPIS